MLRNRCGESPRVNLEIKFSLGDREREMTPPLNQVGDLINKTGFECVYRDSGKTMNVRCCKLNQELSSITICINGRPAGKFVPTMQAAWLRHADLDPGGNPSSEIPNEDRGFVPGSDTLSQLNAVRILETVRKDAHQHVFEGFRWLPGNEEIELFVNSAIDISQIDLEVVNRGGQGHGYAANPVINIPVY